MLQDRSGKDVAFLAENVAKFVAAAREKKELTGVTPMFSPGVPQIFVNVDRDKVLKQGVDLSAVYQTLQTFMGGYFVNYFNRFGRQWQVFVQAEGDYRTNVDQVGQFFVKNKDGAMVPLSAITNSKPISGPEFTMRYNLYRSAQINAAPAPGYSSGQAMKAMEEVFKESMPNEMGFAYSGMSFQEKQASEGVSPMVIFGISLLFVFLILAAQYESWTLPFSVLLGTPIAVFGAFAALMVREIREQHLRADRPGDAHRSRCEERNPHHRVCEDETRGGPRPHGSRARGRKVAPAPHPDDQFRIHPRLRSAGYGERRRCALASGHGLRRHRWNAGRQLRRHLSHPGALLPRRKIQRQKTASEENRNARASHRTDSGTAIMNRKWRQRVDRLASRTF